MGLTFDCRTCPFNILSRETTEQITGEKGCQKLRTDIQDGFGIEVPCGVAGAAIADLAAAGIDKLPATPTRELGFLAVRGIE